MKYYIKDTKQNDYFKEYGHGTTSDINKAHLYGEEEAKYRVRLNNYRLKLIPETEALIKPNSKLPKILILGNARHGKDTVAEMIVNKTELKMLSSSKAALEAFPLFDILRDKYELYYETEQEAWEDRVNWRKEWYDEICLFNKDNKLNLVNYILSKSDIYIGLRNYLEVEEAIKNNTFDHIIGVYDYRKPREDKSSNSADVFQYSDFVIMNNGTLGDLESKVEKIILKTINGK